MRTTASYNGQQALGLVLLLTISSVVCCGTDVGQASTAYEMSVAERIAARDFPSVFQAWSRVENIPETSFLEGIARHDLMWSCIGLGGGLRWDAEHRGLAERFEPRSIQRVRKVREQLLKLNPNIILIAEIRYRDAHPRWLPEGHKWWMRNEYGRIIKGWKEGGFLLLDYKNPEYRRHVAKRAKAAMASGVADGIMLDWWNDDEERLALVTEIRAAIGDEPLIIVNTNHRKAPRTASYVNGLFMECYRSKTPEDWRMIADTLTWAEQNLRPPRVNCIEVWYHNSRRDLPLMRAVTTLALTHSNGYCLFSDPNPLPSPDHLHDWYEFWDKSLGKPIAPSNKRKDGAVIREFERGTVVYNPMGNRSVEVVFDNVRISRATGKSGKTHTLKSADGDIYLHAADQATPKVGMAAK
ncbi:MAG: alpha-amylase family protein [Planctomycetota bacterium]